jgi:hypothetical protein
VISSDLFFVEKGLAFTSLIIAVLPVNIFTYVLIGYLSNW